MEFGKTDYLAAGFFFLLAGITVYGFLNIQGDVAVHFDSSGQADSTMGKVPGLLILPAISVSVFALLKYIPRIDPLGENIEEFKPALEGVASGIIGFLSYTQGLIVGWNLELVANVSRAVVPAVAALFYALGLLFERAERNWFIGLRTPWTLSSDEVWEKTHDRAAPLFKFAAVFSLGGLIYPERSVEFAVLPAVAVSLYATVHSFVLYRKLEEGQ
jgi:uncharacterized membrane protein